MASLDFDGRQFTFDARTEGEHTQAKKAGFIWARVDRLWYTRLPAVAAGLRVCASLSAETTLNRLLISVTPWTLPLPPLPKGLTLAPHQREAVLFALSRNRAYLRLDPGLGKTICAAVIARALAAPCVYVSPPFLVRNVENEFRRFAPHLCIDIYGQEIYGGQGVDVLIIPDSLLLTKGMAAHVKSYLDQASWLGPGLLIVDEAHRFKTETAKRTRMLFGDTKEAGLFSLFPKQVYMSGTPMPNRPIELYPLLSKVAPDAIDHMGFFDYAKKYCAAYESRFGWDFSGASNMDDLERRLIHPQGKFMLRQKKALLNLPPKTEEIFVVSADMSAKLAKMDEFIGRCYLSIEDLIKKRLSPSAGEMHLMTYRKLLGVEKIKPALKYIESLLDETDEAILVFAYHKDVIAGLVAGLARHAPIVITGQTPPKGRQRLVEQFQNGVSRLVVGNYLAMGVGFTLTRATRALFVEFDWAPGVNDQAGDRIHRIGQDKSVLIQFMVYRDSLDKAVIETLLKKRKAAVFI